MKKLMYVKMPMYIHDMRFNDFESMEKQIIENSASGYETAICGKNLKAVKYGSLVSDKCELPDKPKNCFLFIWGNDNIDAWLKERNYKTDW